jgi:hypothetical protein
MEICGQLHALVGSPPETQPPVFIGQESRWAPGPVGRYGEDNLTPAGNRTPTVQPVAIPTEISRYLPITKIGPRMKSVNRGKAAALNSPYTETFSHFIFLPLFGSTRVMIQKFN